MAITFVGRRKHTMAIGPVLVMLAMSLQMARSGVGTFTGQLTLAILVTATLMATWTFLVPMLTIRDDVMAWRATPLSRPTTIDLTSVRQMKMCDTSCQLVLEMDDSSKERVFVELMARSDLDRIQRTLRSAISGRSGPEVRQ